MTAPSVRAWATAKNIEDSLPAFSVNLPTRVAGDLLLCFVAGDYSTAVTPTGSWSERLDSNGGGTNRVAIYARLATNDANDALSVAGANNQDSSVNVCSIQNHGITDVTSGIVIATPATGSDAAANPPSADGGSSKDWLALAVAVVDLTATGSSITALPGSYSGGVMQKSASSTSSVALGVGERALSAAQTEDPGTFTNTSGAWLTTTVLVPPSFATVQASADLTFGGLDVAATATVHTPVQASADLTWGALDIQATATVEQPPASPVFENSFVDASSASETATIAFTVGTEADRELLVGISVGEVSGTARTITSVVWNGTETMTEVYSSSLTSATGRIALYRLHNPSSGTHNVVITVNGSAPGTHIVGCVSSWYNVAADLGNVETIIPTSTSLNLPTFENSPVDASSIVVGWVIHGDAITGVGPSQLEQDDRFTDYSGGCVGLASGTGSTAITITGTSSANDWWGGIGVELVGASGGGPQTIEASALMDWGGLEITAHIPETIQASALMDWGGLEITAFIPEPTKYLTGVSANKRYLLDQNDDPWFMQGTTPQLGLLHFTMTDWDNYLSDQAGRGYNFAQVHLVACNNFVRFTQSGNPNNVNNDPPFGTMSTFANPDTDYWAWVDDVIALAQSYGFTLQLTMVDNISFGEHFSNMNDSDCYNYGTFLGNRYKNTPGILWSIGNDYDSSQWFATDGKYAQLLDGIRDTGDTHPATLWLLPNANTSWDNDYWDSLVEVVLVYTYDCPYKFTLDAWNDASSTAPKPVFLGEASYQFEHNGGAGSTSPLSLRKEAWWPITWGAIGGFVKGQYPEEYATSGWDTAITDSGGVPLGYVAGIFTQFDGWWNLEPDQTNTVLTGGRGTYASGFTDPADNDYFSLSITDDGTLAIGYCPTQRSGITIDTSHFSGTVTAHWWDPTLPFDGQTPISISNVAAPTHPGVNDFGDYDWVLVIQGTVSGQNYSQTITDALGGTDSYGADTVRPLTDTAGMLDSVTGNLGSIQTFTDPVGILDAYSVDTVRPVTDPLGLLDPFTQAAVDQQTVTDPLGLTDSQAKGMTTALTDPLGLLDATTQETGTEQVFTDALGLVDSQTQNAGTAQTFTDPVGLTDSSSRLSVSSQTATNALGAVDSQVASLAASQAVTDALGMVDGTAQLTGTQQTFTDPVGLTDSRTQETGTAQTFTDAVGLTDSQTQTSVVTQVIVDVMGILDAQLQAAAIASTLTDPLGLTDAMSGNLGSVQTVTDVLGLLDSRAQQTGTGQTLTDSFGMVDSTAQAQAVVAAITDAVGMLDSQLLTYQLTKEITDAVGMLDSASPAEAVVRILSDVLEMLDRADVSGLVRYITDAYWGADMTND